MTQNDITQKVMEDLGMSRRPTVNVFQNKNWDKAWKGLATYATYNVDMWFNGRSYGSEKEGKIKATCLNHYEIRYYLTTHEFKHLQLGDVPDGEYRSVKAGIRAIKKHRRNPFRFIAAFFWRIK